MNGIFTCRPDGSDVQQVGALTPNVRNHCHVHASDICFTEYLADESQPQGSNIAVMTLDGTDVGPIVPTSHPVLSLNPTWSPDGSHLVFCSDRLSMYPGFLDIMKVDLNTLAVTPLAGTALEIEADPHWGSTKIVYDRYSSSHIVAIWMCNEDGSSPVRVLKPPVSGQSQSPYHFGDYDPKLSPNGRYVAFERHQNDDLWPFGWPYPIGNWNVLIWDIQLKRTRTVIGGAGVDLMPCWSPDGLMLAYWQLYPSHSIWVCNAFAPANAAKLSPSGVTDAEMPDWYLHPTSGEQRLIFNGSA